MAEGCDDIAAIIAASTEPTAWLGKVSPWTDRDLSKYFLVAQVARQAKNFPMINLFRTGLGLYIVIKLYSLEVQYSEIIILENG